MSALSLDLVTFVLRLSVVFTAVTFALAVGLFLLRQQPARVRVRLIRVAILTGLVGIIASWPGWSPPAPVTVDTQVEVLADGSRIERHEQRGWLLAPRPVRLATLTLMTGWLVGLALLSIGLGRVHRLRAAARRLCPGTYETDALDVPVAVGIFDAVVILPARIPRDRQLGWILAHERAHVAHADPRWLFLAALLRALCFFHPGASWIRRRLELEQERAADECVVAAGADPRSYAHALLDWAEGRLDRPRLMPVATASPTQLERRLRWLLSPGDRRPRLRLLAVALLLLVLALSTVGRGVPALAIQGGAESVARELETETREFSLP